MLEVQWGSSQDSSSCYWRSSGALNLGWGGVGWGGPCSGSAMGGAIGECAHNCEPYMLFLGKNVRRT